MNGICYGNILVNRLRENCDKIKKRLWIAVPFIGSWEKVKLIIGTKWITDTSVDVRLLTDERNEKLIKADTFNQFRYRAQIKTLDGLHAKIYIIDDNALLTSANLTGTAFSKRYEFGIFQKIDESLENLFEDWWGEARVVDPNWRPKGNLSRGNNHEEISQIGLPVLWGLPGDSIKIKVFKKYHYMLNLFNHFMQRYQENVSRLWNKLPIYHEIDSFLNYLFHEHPQKPSHQYLKKEYRKLSENRRIDEIKRYHKQFCDWANITHKDSEADRNNNILLVQASLSKKNIDQLNSEKTERIVNAINAMKSLRLNKKRFLNKRNNTNQEIIEAWKILIHSNEMPVEIRMEECHNSLYSFGESCIQELISFYFPEEYPPINRNTRSGLRFFGYDL